MANLRPSLDEIITRIENDARARLDTEELRRSDLAVFIRVIAGASHALYSAIEFGRKQLFSDSAEVAYLERLGSIYGIVRKQATQSTGKVKFVYSSTAVDVPLGTIVQVDDEHQYITTVSPDEDGIAEVRAVNGGSTYDLPVDTELSLPNPVAGVTGAVVYEEITGGEDEETDEALRERVLARTQNPPRQGTKEDYVAWALEVEGVGYAWCFPKEMGEGTVTVRILDTEGNIPTQDLIDAVQEHIESKNDVLATIYVVAPIEQNVNFTIELTPDSLSLHDLVKSAIKEVFTEEAAPGGTIYLSHINAAISAISSEEDHKIITPDEDLVAESNAHLLRLGEITWQS